MLSRSCSGIFSPRPFVGDRVSGDKLSSFVHLFQGHPYAKKKKIFLNPLLHNVDTEVSLSLTELNLTVLQLFMHMSNFPTGCELLIGRTYSYLSLCF